MARQRIGTGRPVRASLTSWFAGTTKSLRCNHPLTRTPCLLKTDAPAANPIDACRQSVGNSDPEARRLLSGQRLGGVRPVRRREQPCLCRSATPQLETSSAALNPGFEAKSGQYSQVVGYSKDPESESYCTVSVGIPQALENGSGEYRRAGRADDRTADRASVTRSSLLVLGIQFSVADAHHRRAGPSAQPGMHDVRG